MSNPTPIFRGQRFRRPLLVLLVILLAASGIYLVHPSHAANADINADGKVDIKDLSIIAAHYDQSGMTFAQGDLNGDGKVNVYDLSILAAAWGTGSTSISCMPNDPAATAAAKNLLNLLCSLPTRPTHRILSGQFIGNSSGYATNVSPITSQTGQAPAVIGYDFDWEYNGGATCNPASPRTNNWQDIASDATTRGQAGNIIEISFHFDNPVTGCQYNDLSAVSSAILTPGTQANNNLNASLDDEVNTFLQLQSHSIPVLFRPYHEMNGNWFWWGSISWYPQLWQYTYNYLTSHGVHNALYIYSPYSWADMSHYPGNGYVDVVGVDTYDANPTNGQWISAQQTYQQSSAAPGKPFGVAEFGFANPAPPANTYDNTVLLTALDTTQVNAPGASYFLSWSDAYGIQYQKNLSTLYNDPSIANLGQF